MKIVNKKGAFALLAVAAVLAVALAAVPAAVVSAVGGADVSWKENFGGPYGDILNDITATSDGGFVAVGYSQTESFGAGDWWDVPGKGGTGNDAVIIKFDASGGVIWKKNFGGTGDDRFYGITAMSDGGFVAVGYSVPGSFGTGDWWDVPAKGGPQNAIAVKFDASGGVIWKKSFEGSDALVFFEAVASGSGFVAVGHGNDAVIAKFNAAGDADWWVSFGGSGPDVFWGVTGTSDGGFVAVGYSGAGSFNSGDWTGVAGEGGDDAIIVRFDASGGVIWKKNFGGPGDDYFYGVTGTSDGGFAAVGYSGAGSFAGGDWGAVGKGDVDATLVRFNAAGGVIWNKNFGGADYDLFRKITATSDGGFAAAGYSIAGSFGNGDWTGITGKGGIDAVIVRFTASGVVDWAVNFGGSNHDVFEGMTATPDGGFAVVGYSYAGSFGSGDWTGVTGKGGTYDAVIVKYRTFVPVSDITGVPSSASAGKSLALSGTVTPSNATYKAVTWSLKNAGTTGATIGGSTLSLPSAGTVVVTATVIDGLAPGTPYTKDFTINVTTASGTFVPVTDIVLDASSMTAGTSMTLVGTVFPSDATNRDILWSVSDGGATGAGIDGSMLSAADPGTVIVTATVIDGEAVGKPFTKDFSIAVTDGAAAGGEGTGSGIWLWAVLALIAAALCILILILLFKRRKNDENEPNT